MLICTLALLAVAAVLGLAQGEASAASKRLFGVSASTDPTTEELQRLARGGGRTVRILFYWGAVEPTPGSRNWTQLDAQVEKATRARVTLLPVVYGTAPWLGSDTRRAPIYTPEARSAWGAFVRDLVGRYGSNGTFWTLRPDLPRVPIQTWQIWNEVNLTYYWGGRPNARQYVRLLRLTRTAMRSVDQTSKLILAGLIPFKSAGGGVSGETYLKDVYKVGGVRRLFDAVAIHPYGGSPPIVLRALFETRKLLNSLGARRVPIWVTEFGWATGGHDLQSSPLRATPTQQARRVSRTYRLMKRNSKRLRLKRALYFSYTDFSDPSDSWISHMGLFNINGDPKPAWYAFARRAGGQP